MASLDIVEINKQFPDLLNRVEAGEEVIIEKSGKPIAKIVPIQKKRKRELGKERGRIWMSKDFNDPLPKEILAEFSK